MALKTIAIIPFIALTLRAQSTGGCSIEKVAGRDPAAAMYPAVANRFILYSQPVMSLDPQGNMFVIADSRTVVRLDGTLLQFAAGDPPRLPSDQSNPTPPTFTSLIDLLADADGGLTLLDGSQIRHWAADGTVGDIAGSTTLGFKGDGGPAINARFTSPTTLARAADGSMLIADAGNYRIRRIDRNGNIDTIAGLGGGDPTVGEGGDATLARIGWVAALAPLPDGTLYFVESQNSPVRLRMIDGQGVLRTVGPLLSASDSDTPVDPSALLNGGGSIAAGEDGHLYIMGSRSIRVLRDDGKLHTIFTWTAAANQNYQVRRLAVKSDGTIFFSASSASVGVFQLSPGGTQPKLVVGNDLNATYDGVPALTANLIPGSVARDANGSLYFSDASGIVYRLQPDGTLASYWQRPASLPFPLTLARFAFDAKGRMVFVDRGVLWRIGLDGTLSQLAGGGSSLTMPFTGAGADFGGVFGAGRLGITSDGGVIALASNPGYPATVALYRIADDGSMTPLWQPNASGLTLGFNLDPNSAIIWHDDGSILIGSPGAGAFSYQSGTLIRYSSGVVTTVSGPQGALTVIDMAEESPGGDLLILDNSRLSERIAATGDVLRFNYLNGYVRDWTGSSTYGGSATAIILPDGLGNAYAINRPREQIELLHNYSQCMTVPTPEVNLSPQQGLPAIYGVAPGSTVTLTGANLGPLTEVDAVEDDQGKLPFTLGGVSVTVDGQPAPVLAAQNTSMTFQVPYGLDGASILARQSTPNVPGLPIVVSYYGTTGPEFDTTFYATYLAVQLSGEAASYPGQPPYAYARNADGTVNTATSPAKLGTMVSVYLTGVGELSPPRAAGDAPVLPVRPAAARITMYQANGYYGGIAVPLTSISEVPGKPGLHQLNFIANLAGPITATIGSMSQTFAIHF